MLERFKKRKTDTLTEAAKSYVLLNYPEPVPPKKKRESDHERYSIDLDVYPENQRKEEEARKTGGQNKAGDAAAPSAKGNDGRQDGGIKFSVRDHYNSGTIQTAMRGLSDKDSPPQNDQNAGRIHKRELCG